MMHELFKQPFISIRGEGRYTKILYCSFRMIIAAGLISLFSAGTIHASPLRATIEYQPMTSDGLAAGFPFEAWVVFDKSSNPGEPGYAFPAGATFRFTFPQSFAPQSGTHPEIGRAHV